MSSRLVAVRLSTREPGATAAFWAALLGREARADRDSVLLPGTAGQVGLRFVADPSQPQGRARLHLHRTSETLDDQRRIVEQALALGGGRRGSRPLPFGRDVYLTDPGGNELCVIAPGDDYLAGTGPLGEITCAGSRAAAQFWAAALEWPVVWDEEEQLVIQSPAGGTKIGWDTWPDPVHRDRQRFELAAADPQEEEARLIGIGARSVGREGDELVFIDPDGDPFSLAPERLEGR